MEVVIVPDAHAMGALVAGFIAQLVAKRPNAVLGLATGSSPLPIYRDLERQLQDGSLSLAGCKAFLLDEYVGLTANHPQSYRATIGREVTERLDIPPDAVVGPDGSATDLLRACEAYENALMAAGGIDIQLLGIGVNGHVGFNEPTSSLASGTRVKTLSAQTRADNARFFESADEVPRHVMTQGIGTILRARHLVLVATGERKATAVAAAVEGPLSAFVPASALQLHPHATVVVDETAASQLQLAPYYRATYNAKPPWQGL